MVALAEEPALVQELRSYRYGKTGASATCPGLARGMLEYLALAFARRAPVIAAPTGRAPTGRAPTGRAPTGRAPAGGGPRGGSPAGRAPAGRAPQRRRVARLDRCRRGDAVVGGRGGGAGHGRGGVYLTRAPAGSAGQRRRSGGPAIIQLIGRETRGW